MPHDTYPHYPAWLAVYHRELDGCVDALGNSSMVSVSLPSRNPVFKSIDAVVDAAHVAFQAEERELLRLMLTKTNDPVFPELHAHHQRHTLEHNSFLNGMRTFRSQYDRVPRSAIGIYAFARAWLDSHRDEADTALCVWCAARQPTEPTTANNEARL